MKRSTSIWQVVALLALMGRMFAQSAPPSPSADATVKTDKNASSHAPSDFFGASIGGHWVFTAEFGFNQEYDDNVFSSPSIRLSDNVSRITARFSAAVQKKRLRMQVHYYPDYASYSKYSDRNALSNQLASETHYRWSAHTDLNWTLTAGRTPESANTPFTLVEFGSGTFLPVFRPDALQNDATITNANTNLGWSHQFNPAQTLQINLQGSVIDFKSDHGVPLSTAIARRSFSSGGSIRWDDEFRPKRKIGVEFGDQYFGLLTPSSHSHYQFAKLRYSQTFGNGYQFSAGAGPSRTERQATATFAGNDPNSIDYAVDVSLAKASARQSIGVTYNHGSQLGLTQGSLGSDSVSASYLRQLGRKWHWDSGFGYSRVQSETAFTLTSVNSYSANGSIEYQLMPQLSFNAGYSYVFQDLGQNILGSNFDRNVFRVGLKYRLQGIASR
jgi:hypothetical protein